MVLCMRIIATTLLLVVAFALPAIAQSKNSVSIGMRLEPSPGLDPTTGAAAAISQVTMYNIFESLTRIDETGKVGPMLANSWTISDDGLTYQFHLVPGATFHDGTDFDSSDVQFNVERNSGTKSKNKLKAVFSNIARVETPSPATVILTLKAPSAVFAIQMAQAPAAMVAPESAESNATNPIGTGPYRFIEWIPGDSVRLEKFAAHRNAANVQIELATFRFINDAAAQAAALLAGDLDYMPNLSAPEMFSQFESDPNFTALKGTTEGETILAINNLAGPLADVRVRRALMHAIDRQGVIDAANAGYGTPIGSHFAPHQPAYLDLTNVYPYDPDKARALLREAGHADGLNLSLRLPPPTYARRGGEVIVAMLAEVGIIAKIENIEWGQWLEQVFTKKQFDLTVISHVEPLDLDRYENPNYYWQYDSAEFRTIMENFRQATTVAEQTEYLQQAQRKLTEDAVNGFIFEGPKLGVARKGLNGMWASWPDFINEIAAMSWAP
jgi:peptide/nickel transport system substrate-binding protein